MASPKRRPTRCVADLVILVALGPLLALGPYTPAAAQQAVVSDLRWLAGCWAGDGGEPGSGEQWMDPAGGTMLGMSRTVRDGRTVGYEFLHIAESDDGNLVLVALPSGQQTTRFPLQRLGDRQAVFENPEHDFPQRIIYQLDATGRLQARIEGQRNGRTVAAPFTMNRVPCATGAD